MDKSIVRQLERFAEESTAALEELESGHLYSEEAYTLMGKINSFLKENLEPDTKEFRIFDKLKERNLSMEDRKKELKFF